MVGMHLGILSVVSFADLTAGMLMAHAFVFDPGWVGERLKRKPEPEIPIVSARQTSNGGVQISGQ